MQDPIKLNRFYSRRTLSAHHSPWERNGKSNSAVASAFRHKTWQMVLVRANYSSQKMSLTLSNIHSLPLSLTTLTLSIHLTLSLSLTTLTLSNIHSLALSLWLLWLSTFVLLSRFLWPSRNHVRLNIFLRKNYLTLRVHLSSEQSKMRKG